LECYGSALPRLVQIATEVFGLGTVKGRTFIRVRHDTWQPWQEIYTPGNTNFNEFGETTSINAAIAIGYGQSATAAVFFLPINSFSQPTGLTVTGAFTISTMTNAIITASLSAASIASGFNVTSNGRFAIFVVSGLSGVTPNLPVYLATNSADANIKVNF
jgi:hypothetical protein